MPQINILFSEEPDERDWGVLLTFLDTMRKSQPLMDTPMLEIWLMPENMRPAEQANNELRDVPVLKTVDDPGTSHAFTMWHFADGSDSEG